MILLSLLTGIACAWAMTAGARSIALKVNLIDHPNERSSHSVPTPRGGGVAIVVSFTALMVGMYVSGLVPKDFITGLVGGGLIVAIVGFIDDRRPVPARWRFLAHACAAVWVLRAVNGIPPVPIFGFSADLGWFGLALAALYVAWMVNLFNFMDGIDGLASIEAITVSLGGALCWWLATATPYWFVPVAFAACVAGFLILNFPPAKIFMGDSGSGFIGLVLALMSLWTGQQAPQVFWCWFILIGGFMVDASTTVVRRVRRGDRFYQAHRSHAYQYASRKHGAHKPVSLAFGLINVLWLLPLAIAVAKGVVDGVAASFVAYMPLVWLAFRYKAGDRKAQET